MNSSNSIDQAVWRFFINNRVAWLNEPQVLLSDAFQPRWVTLMAVVLTVVIFLRSRTLDSAFRWARILYPALTLIVAITISSALKHLIGRERPLEAARLVVETNPSMPSGHAIAAFALATVLSVLTRSWWTVPAWIVAVLVAINRLYVGVHWLSDVLVGASIGTAVALLMWQLLQRAARSQAARRKTARRQTVRSQTARRQTAAAQPQR